MNKLEDVFKQVNKELKKELCRRGINHVQLKRIPFTSPRLNYETYGGIPRGRVTMFAGKESSGKSTTALDVIKNAQITFRYEWEQEVLSLSNRIEELNKLIGDKNTSKSKKEEAKKEVAPLVERLNYLNARGVLQIVYFDAEGTIDKDWAAKLGVDPENLWLVQLHTQTAEQFLDTVIRTVRDAENVGLVVIDSIAVLVPQLTHDSSLEQKSMGGNAAVVTEFVNKVCPVLNEKDIACIIINQARDDFSNPYADFKIPCGNGLKLASSLILTFQKGKLLDAEGAEQKNSFETPQGNYVWVRVQKTKIFKPDRRVGFYTLSYDYGVDVVADLIPMAVDLGIIEKAGSWFKIVDPMSGEYLTYEDNGETIKFQGQLNLMTFLRENKEAFQFINDHVMAKITGKELQVDAEADREAIEDLQAEAEESGVKTRSSKTKSVEEQEQEAKDAGLFIAEDEIPIEDEVAV